jgi:RNA polymerase sigma-70 factor (ECF subfamily)
VDADPELVRRAARGDREAFDRLVRPHWPRLHALTRRGLASPEDAADALQETLLRAWQGLPRFRGDAQLSTWLHRICLNAVHDQRERTAARRTAPLDEVPEAPDRRDRFADAELSAQLAGALDGLEEEYRVAVVLCDLCGCSYAEAAELLGVPEGTIKSRIFRGRRTLAQRLGTYAADEPSNQ